jgi:hypothetical protein
MITTKTAHAHDASFGPGWFDSSMELMRGLDVREGLPADASLNEWLMAALGSMNPLELLAGRQGRAQAPELGSLALAQG